MSRAWIRQSTPPDPLQPLPVFEQELPGFTREYCWVLGTGTGRGSDGVQLVERSSLSGNGGNKKAENSSRGSAGTGRISRTVELFTQNKRRKTIT
jgi:hypothetical protein